MGFTDGRVLRVVLKAVNTTVDEITVVNTLHYDLHDDAANPANDPQSLADVYRDSVMGVMATLFDSDWNVQPVEIVEEVDPLSPLDPRGSWTSGAEIPGTRNQVGDLLPYGVCGVASLKTAFIGRRFRGRMFLGAQLTEADQASNTWAPTLIGLWEAFVAAIPRQPDIASGVSSSKADWSVYSRTQRSQNLDPYLVPVVSAAVRPNVHFLRSRSR